MKPLHVLLAPLGSRGDVQPQLVLGEELTRRGHRVTLAAPPNFRAWGEERGFHFVPVGEDINSIIRKNQGMTEQHPVVALPAQIRLVREQLARQVNDLFAAPQACDIVVAAGLSFAGKMVADQLRVPHVFCCYTLSAMLSAEHPPAVAPVFGLPRLGNRLLWSTITGAFQLTLGRKLNELRTQRGLLPERGSWQSIHAQNVILAQDAVMGELPPDVPGDNVHVPAIVPNPDEAKPLSDLLERFLRGAGEGSAGAPPVVYIGFGSMPTVDRARVVRIAIELFERHGARVVLHSSHAEDAGVELPPGVFSTGDLDHTTLFPRVDLIVHHGGAGTTAAALRSGVPQLIVPHIVDQFFHGRRIAELGAGPPPVPKAKLTADAIAAALKDRFNYWAKAQSLRSTVARNGGAQAAADRLEQLASNPP
ncbi:MAG: glycosyltransferase [Myxococcales bacterium]|nr:MAG: glycosyltransferase [Myxococcales bacterium]